ncbi:MAG: heavy metal translocating P-type ATPase [Syntrophothermus sp.]
MDNAKNTVESSLKKFSLPVEGMTCASCVARVEKALGKVEGVQNVAVNFATEKANFEIDLSKTNLTEIARVVEDAGYKVNLPQEKREVNPDQEETAEEHEGNEFYRKLSRDLLFSLVLTIPVFIISMTMEFTWFHRIFPPSVSHIRLMDYINKILLVLTTPVIFISGKRFFTVFWNNLRHKAADMNSLVAIGTGAAYLYSLIATLFPELVTAEGKAAHVYYDSTAVIITLILLGRWLENRAKQKTGSAIRKLLELKPKTATVRRLGKELQVKIDDLSLGDIVVVKPGEKIPADGKIIEGFSTIDESMITGESIPVEKGKGSKIVGGTINKNGSFDFEITALGGNSVLGQIIKLVEEAQGSKAPIQKMADKLAGIFVPVVIAISLVTFTAWLIFGGAGSFNPALINFVAVLIIACPCALGLATPTAIMVGTGLGANHGILIKNGESLELAHKINTIILDKTGTITEGRPTVTDIINHGISKEELLSIAASVENKSEHPIAQAIVEYAKERNINPGKTESFQSFTGHGISAVVDGQAVAVGNEKLMADYSLKIDGMEKDFSRLSEEGKTVVFVAINGELKGMLAVEDPVKETSVEAIDALKKMNIHVVMLTGDNRKTAAAIAKRIGLDNFSAEILPADKANEILKYQKQGSIVAMAGDGINDAPALAQSNVGIAMGNGTDVAIETSDITLIKGDLTGVVNAIRLSRQTIRTIKQNLFWAFIYNVLGIPLAALGMLNPMFAALAMSFSSVSVVSNSLRLRRFRIGKSDQKSFRQ